MTKEKIILVVGVTGLTWIVAASLFGLPTNFFDASKPFVTSISTAGLVIWAHESFGWKWPIVRSIMGDNPDLTGVWRVELNSTWVDPNTSQKADVVEGFVQIDQKAATLCLRLFTAESESVTSAHSFVREDKVCKLVIVYQNDPSIELRNNDISSSHSGAAAFRIRGHNPKDIKGEYWTDRETSGTIRLFDKNSKKSLEINSFEDGLSGYA